ncbi:MAG: M20/M25/M40 family metallo-hydrolase [Chitinophagaceae bacterium]|nr:M20/M25/M40 family metallo-hydrolase [Chitinophagaceae bacterium]
MTKKITNKFILLLATIFSLLATNNASAQNNITGRQSQQKQALLTYEKYFDDNKEKHLQEFMELISIPSISSMPSHKADVKKAAAWIVNKLQSIGMTTAMEIPTAGNPIVFGSWDKAPGKPTVLIYAHYDIQPVKESEWDYPPFKPVVSGGKILGRGASDDKSGVMISIWAIEAMLKKDGKLPVNVKFLFEGEEEIGSTHFHDFLVNHKDQLKADYALNADGGQASDTDPAIVMSLRGAITMEFSVKTANIDAHSGQYGGKTPNSAVILSQIISSFYTKEGNVAVAGFYDKVIPLTAAEKTKLKQVPYNPAKDMQFLGTTAEAGDATYSPLERIWYRPTLEITGIQGGYTAPEGSSNIIPSNAFARITCRLVSNQDGYEIIDLIKKHIAKNTPPGASISYKPSNGGFARPMKFPADTKAFTYVSNALINYYGKEPIQDATGGTVGALVEIKEQLGIYAYSLGFQQPDEKWHGANEFLRVSSIRKGQMIYCYYLQQLGTTADANK